MMPKGLTQEEERLWRLATAKQWEKGDLSYLLHPDGQSKIYNAIKKYRKDNPNSVGPFVICCHRQLGKSFLGILSVLEQAVKKPYQHICLVSNTFEQCADIVELQTEKLLDEAPDSIIHNQVANEFSIYNKQWEKQGYKKYELKPSKIKFHGTSKQSIKKLRGPSFDLMLIEEARDFDSATLESLIDTIFVPQTIGHPGSIIVIISTLPDTIDHSYYSRFIDTAKRKNAYIEIAGPANSDYTAEDDAKLVEHYGSRDCPAYKQEILCIMSANTKNLVIPEFSEIKDANEISSVVVKSYKRPDFFFPVVGLDFGFTDYTAAVFGYWDFLNELGVVEAEIFRNQMNTEDFIKLLKQTEVELWGKNPPKPIMRFGDSSAKQQIMDMCQMYHIAISPTEKHDKKIVIAELRKFIGERKIKIIGKECPALLHQLASVQWNTSRTKYLRGGDLVGHGDALDGFIYWFRNLPRFANPIPEQQMKIGNRVIKYGKNSGRHNIIGEKHNIRR